MNDILRSEVGKIMVEADHQSWINTDGAAEEISGVDGKDLRQMFILQQSKKAFP